MTIAPSDAASGAVPSPPRLPAAGLATLFRDHLRLFAILFVFAMALGAVLRVVLYASFHDGDFRVVDLALALASGVLFDAMSLLLAALPFLLFLSLFGGLFRPALIRVPFLVVALGVLGFNAAAEYCYFEEFNARYNHIALDYLRYPHEVFGNIGESYNVPAIVGGAFGVALLLVWPLARLTRHCRFADVAWRQRWRAAGASLLLGAFCAGLASVLPRAVSTNRIVAEIAQNGFAQLWRAWMTAELCYDLYYQVLPRPEARARAARMLGYEPPSEADLARPEGELTMWKKLEPAHADRGYDVVVILEESFGSEFIGVLGHPQRKTSPGFDRWSSEGTLLTNLVATGNRTVRGMEGILCSHLPLPGDSVVRRDHSDNVASIARVFQAKGCRTKFFYGGRGMFDSMGAFARANGYEQFVEQTDYPSEAFRTIWGVADEFVLGAMLEAQKAARANGERYCFTALTVSNHKPYFVPRGRVELLTEKPSRENAVLYADWALADYLDKAKAAGLLDHTIVLAVGDHGARVYGREEIPVPSYRIPALFLHPDAQWRGKKIERLCSQVDLLPSLLSMAGIGCEAPFVGRDILALPPDGGRAFVQHNNEVGLLLDQTMVVLGLKGRLWYYQRSGRDSDKFDLLSPERVTPELRDLAKDTAAVYQTGYELYVHEHFKLR